MYIEDNFRQFVYVFLTVSKVKILEILVSERQVARSLLSSKSILMYRSDIDGLNKS